MGDTALEENTYLGERRSLHARSDWIEDLGSELIASLIASIVYEFGVNKGVLQSGRVTHTR